MTRCFHCGLPADPKFQMVVEGEQRSFCCAGCMAVTSLIMGSGLKSFYDYRENLSSTPALTEDETLKIFDDPDYSEDFVRQSTNNQGEPVCQARIQIKGITCSACAWLIEKHLEQLSLPVNAQVNYSRRTLFLEWDPDQLKLSTILNQVTALGYEVLPDRKKERLISEQYEMQSLLRRLGVSGIGMMQVGMYAIALYAGAFQGMSDASRDLMRYASLLVATMVIFYSAQPFFKAAWRAIKNGHLVMDVPVSIALLLAYSSSLFATWRGTGEVYFDAVCMFTFFLLCSRFLELRARCNWNKEAQPELAEKAWKIKRSGEVLSVAARKLVPGDMIMVKPAEAVPVDASLLDRTAEVDQAQLTGEFSAQLKHFGDTLYAGSINAGDPIRLSVLRPQDQSSLAQIESIAEHAHHYKPAVVRLADRLAGWFVGAVLILSTLSYFLWLQIDDADTAFWVALSVLVVSCPCALSLATPTALTVLMTRLRKRGILVQSPAALETLTKIDQVIFDKTGTLTEGNFQVNWVSDLSNEGKTLQLVRASILEHPSSHPIANAFENTNVSSDKTSRELSINYNKWNYHTGEGIEAVLASKITRIGSKDFVEKIVNSPYVMNEVCEEGSLQKTSLHQESNKQQIEKKVYMGNEDGWLAVFGLSDKSRPELTELMSHLKQYSLALYSGDPSDSVSLLANRVGINEWYKNMTVEDKLLSLQTRQKEGKKVLAVGDGLNDAPLLAAADASIAVSDAVALSKQSADFLLLSNNLLSIHELIDGAERGYRVIKQNLCWALLYNLTAIPFAMFGLVPPWLAALGMSASSAVVVLNALRARPSSKISTLQNEKEQNPLVEEVMAC